MHIVFLDCTQSHYNGETMRHEPLGGIETVTVCLAESFANERENKVTVCNNAPDEFRGSVNNVQWTNYEHLNSDVHHNATVVIANNDPGLFDLYASRTGDKNFYPVLWMHNRMLIEKTIRKGRYAAFVKWHPHGVFLGTKHKNSCSFLHPFRNKSTLPHGLTENFLNKEPLDKPTSPPQAIFFSQAYRGFDKTVDCWMKYIHPAHSAAVLKAFVGDIDLQAHNIPYTKAEMEAGNILFMPRVPKKDLIEHIRHSRLMLYPGHKDETFCNVATEANSLGVPIVTTGIGALSERVEDNKNGFIIHDGDLKATADKALLLLSNDKIWQEMSDSSIRYVQHLTWGNIAQQWEKEVFKYVS